MKLSRLVTNGFRGLPDRTFDFTNAATRAPHDMVFITGPAASGKTRFLDAIIAAKEDIGPYGARRSTAAHVRPGEAAAKLSVDWLLSDDERTRVGADQSKVASESIFGPGILPSFSHDPALTSVLREYDHDPAIGKLEYFHAGRALDVALGTAAMDAREQKYLRLEKSPRKYAALRPFVIELTLGLIQGTSGGPGAASPQRFAELFGSLCGSKSFAGVARSGGGAHELFFQGRDGAQVTLSELSQSEQQAFLFAATAMFIGLCGSVVLIDSPELHLGAGDVVPFVAALAALGVDNQLFIATGCADLIAQAPPQAIIRL